MEMMILNLIHVYGKGGFLTIKKKLNLKLGTQAVRNVMDMDAFFGGFAAALISDPVWVMNVVPYNKPSTLGVIFDRGLIGVYHDW